MGGGVIWDVVVLLSLAAGGDERGRFAFGAFGKLGAATVAVGVADVAAVDVGVKIAGVAATAVVVAGFRAEYCRFCSSICSHLAHKVTDQMRRLVHISSPLLARFLRVLGKLGSDLSPVRGAAVVGDELNQLSVILQAQ